MRFVTASMVGSLVHPSSSPHQYCVDVRTGESWSPARDRSSFSPASSTILSASAGEMRPSNWTTYGSEESRVGEYSAHPAAMLAKLLRSPPGACTAGSLLRLAQALPLLSQRPHAAEQEESMKRGLASHSPADAHVAHCSCESAQSVSVPISFWYAQVRQVAAHRCSMNAASPQALRLARASEAQSGRSSTQRAPAALGGASSLSRCAVARSGGSSGRDQSTGTRCLAACGSLAARRCCCACCRCSCACCCCCCAGCCCCCAG
mmetsp:Transcript_42850/g.135341  ORF Transcript_42850/g.135341 Transcript_42850/m.135341 type:complete len:263 (+) Transcript_42850:615-1403(+)